MKTALYTLAMLFVATGFAIAFFNVINAEDGAGVWFSLYAPAYFLLLLVVCAMLVVLAVAMHALFVAVRAAAQWVARIDGVHAATATQILIAAGIVAAVFPSMLVTLFQTLLRFGMQFFIEAPRVVLRVASQGYLCIQESQRRPDDCISGIVFDGMSGLREVAVGMIFQSGVNELPIATLLYAVVLFAVVTFGLVRLSPQLTVRSRFWIGYAVIAVASIYLALSATLAVPLMQVAAAAPEAATPDELRAELERLRPKGEAAAPEEVAEVSREWLVRLQKVAQEFPDAGYAVETVVAIAENNITEISRIREERNTLVGGFGDEVQGLIDRAVAFYRTESSLRLGSRETAQHFSALQDWFLFVTSDYGQSRDACDRALASAIRLQRDDARRARQALADLDAVKARDIGRDALEDEVSAILMALSDSFVRGETRAPVDVEECASYSVLRYGLPPRPGYGTSLGTVGFAIGWLLGAESMPVTLITGLVGFGLLGALVGRFVRRPGLPGEQDEIGDVAVVVFGGFVAALIVYLAAYGGLAIATEGGGNPNPYVVFAACLVGAVYSSDVWEEARRRFTRKDQS